MFTLDQQRAIAKIIRDTSLGRIECNDGTGDWDCMVDKFVELLQNDG